MLGVGSNQLLGSFLKSGGFVPGMASAISPLAGGLTQSLKNVAGSAVQRMQPAQSSFINPQSSMPVRGQGNLGAWSPMDTANDWRSMAPQGDQTTLHPFISRILQARQNWAPLMQPIGQMAGQYLLSGQFPGLGGSGGAGGGASGGGGAGGAGGAGGGLPGGEFSLGNRDGNYGPWIGSILRRLPQTVLMGDGPAAQMAYDYYLGPHRPSFASVH